jgi:hypothetical protein
MRFYIIGNLCAGYVQFMQILCKFCAPFCGSGLPQCPEILEKQGFEGSEAVFCYGLLVNMLQNGA